MDNENKKTRREFLGDVLWTGSMAAMGGLTCLGMSRESSAENKGTRDLISMTIIDPEMILYEEIHKPVYTGFSESRNVTVDRSGVLYVTGDQAIRVFDSRCRIKETIELTVSPFCLAATDRQFYIGTRDRVVITDKKGKILTTWPGLGDNGHDLACRNLQREVAQHKTIALRISARIAERDAVEFDPFVQLRRRRRRIDRVGNSMFQRQKFKEVSEE